MAVGFAVSVTTVWRYLREAIDLLAAEAADLAEAARRAAKPAYAIIDGTLVPIDRVADQKPYYSGKHKRHGVNVQILADPAGRLVWASPALPGATHDLTAARTHGLIDALTSANVMTFADKGYQGAGGTIWTPFKRRRTRLSRRQKTVNRHHATAWPTSPPSALTWTPPPSTAWTPTPCPSSCSQPDRGCPRRSPS